MDGNGRWADKRGMNRGRGHIAGARKAFEIIDYVCKSNITTLSLFAFSTDNWQRPPAEVNLLMKLMTHSLKTKIAFFQKRNIKLKIIGDLSRLPQGLQDSIFELENKTATNRGLELVIAINYSGQYDICQAVQRLIELKIDMSNLNPSDLSSLLLTANFKNPDLLIRTGGESRLSNFYLWQSAYAEIQFQSKYWPDFETEDLDQHIKTFAKVERRFGKTSDQLIKC